VNLSEFAATTLKTGKRSIPSSAPPGNFIKDTNCETGKFKIDLSSEAVTIFPISVTLMVLNNDKGPASEVSDPAALFSAETTATLLTPSKLNVRIASSTDDEAEMCATCPWREREGRSDKECNGVDRYVCHDGGIGDNGSASSRDGGPFVVFCSVTVGVEERK